MIFKPAVLPTPLYEWTPSVDPHKSGEVLHHIHDSGKSPDVSICHTISSTNSPSVCQLHDSSVCQTMHNSIWKFIHPSECPSSILSIQPSAKFMVKVPRSIAVSKFPTVQIPENSFPSVHHQICLSCHQAVCHPVHHHQLKTCQNSLVIIGECCGKLPA